jgi:hypothetical protein
MGKRMLDTAGLGVVIRGNPRIARKVCPKQCEMIVRVGIFVSVIVLGLLLTIK